MVKFSTVLTSKYHVVYIFDSILSQNIIFLNISGSWDPSETSFAVLNKETAPDVSSVYLTVAADLVMSQVAEPVRFVIETK